MDITISVPDIFGLHKDEELKTLSFLIRKNFPSVGGIQYIIEPVINKHGFTDLPYLADSRLSKTEKLVRLFEHLRAGCSAWLKRHFSGVHNGLLNFSISFSRLFELRHSQDNYYAIGNPSTESQITNFVQTVMLLRMPDKVKNIAQELDENMTDYGTTTERRYTIETVGTIQQ